MVDNDWVLDSIGGHSRKTSIDSKGIDEGFDFEANPPYHDLIHMLNMVFGVGHVYIIKDTNSVIKVGRPRQPRFN